MDTIFSVTGNEKNLYRKTVEFLSSDKNVYNVIVLQYCFFFLYVVSEFAKYLNLLDYYSLAI